MSLRVPLGWALSAGLLTGCTLQASRPAPPVLPATFAPGVSLTPAHWPSRDWYRQFGSTELDDLIGRAQSGNLDLQGARWRIEQTLERAKQARAGLYPSLDGLGNINDLAGHTRNGGLQETDWAALLSASYEIDFWGKNRAAAESARQSLLASRADRDTLALTILAAVANEYFQLLTLRERLRIATDNVETARDLVDILTARFNAGLANPAEVAAERAALAAAQLQVPELERLQAESVTALAGFLGLAPEGFSVHGMSVDDLHEPEVAPGIPAELLRRRPDISRAEANLAAASADTVAARAALYPTLGLTLDGGIANPAVNAAINSLSGTGPSLNLGAGLTQPIFDAGRLRSQSREAQAKEQEAVASYKAAIVAALVDVENSLSALRFLNEARAAQDSNLAQSTQAFAAAKARYRHGNGDFLGMLETQKALYAARDQYSRYKLARLQATLDLGKALGGGWEQP